MTFATLTEFTISNRFEGFPKPLAECPDIIPTGHFDIITNAKGFIWPVGSQTIAGAAHADSDHDFLVLTKDRIPEVFSGLGYDLLTGGVHYEPSEGRFNSWVANRVNFVATDDEWFAKRFLAANEVAKKLVLTNKAHRISLFQAVLYGRVHPTPNKETNPHG